MHFAISASWGPTDPTRAMLPFIFAASALQEKDTVTIMLFHDAVHLALKEFAEKIVPVGPPQRFESKVISILQEQYEVECLEIDHNVFCRRFDKKTRSI